MFRNQVAQLCWQPGEGGAPSAFDSWSRDAHDLSRLFNRQSAKKAKLDDPGSLRINLGQGFERLIEREQVHGLLLRDLGGGRERNLPPVAAAFAPPSVARVIYQELAH